MRWGSDWTFDSGDWWSELATGNESPVYREPNDSGAGFRYFWADAIQQVFFPFPIIGEDLQNLWLDPWRQDPPQMD